MSDQTPSLHSDQDHLLMTAAELTRFNLHLQNLNFDASHFRVQYSKDGAASLRHAGVGEPPQSSRNSLRVINGFLYQGLAEVEADETGYVTAVRPKPSNPRCSPRKPRPTAYMNTDEVREFEQALDVVQRHTWQGHCKFDSWRDDNDNLFTISRVSDGAPADDVAIINEALRVVTTRLHEGSAVRVPLPDGGVMLTARWDLRHDDDR